jgi:carotenoid cleavage dioxygenase-like enzyme
MHSRLLLFRAKELSAGAITTIEMPIRLRSGLHGNRYPPAPSA